MSEAGGAYRRWGKRTADLCLVFPALLVLSPILVLIAGATLLATGRPVVFRQLRPGLAGRPFTILKFRTMANTVVHDDSPRTDAARLSRWGKLLRASSLDELPELFNIVKGDMSFVGPRPLLMRYLGRYSPEQMRRHEVRPGITGWAQINGRNALTWEEKFALDVWYVDNLSPWLDAKILALTLWKTLKHEGINQPGQATAEEFMGSPHK